NPWWQLDRDNNREESGEDREAKEEEEEEIKGLHSFIRCFTYVLNLMVKKILKVLKTRSMSEANDLVDDLEPTSTIPELNPLQKIRVLTIWIT
ncbi:hypothetical protein N7495_007391, partial [Penicillium taxi]|uniref:uncharacterized protein n=1 Tax=Penicillium taxi TaxID=168475 RepID=UPI002545423A